MHDTSHCSAKGMIDPSKFKRTAFLNESIYILVVFTNGKYFTSHVRERYTCMKISILRAISMTNAGGSIRSPFLFLFLVMISPSTPWVRIGIPS